VLLVDDGKYKFAFTIFGICLKQSNVQRYLRKINFRRGCITTNYYINSFLIIHKEECAKYRNIKNILGLKRGHFLCFLSHKNVLKNELWVINFRAKLKNVTSRF
jgi:hypothetical protein